MGSDISAKPPQAAQEVSIHAPAWGATGHYRRAVAESRFQFTLPRGERQPLAVASLSPLSFQFTLPRGERHAILFGIDFDDRVSIHAPAWGATGRPLRSPYSPQCFNSRSRVGSDCRGAFRRLRDAGFNSRSRVGSDRTPPGRGLQEVVSIHAPAWGATPAAGWHHRRGNVSIHAPAWGATFAFPVTNPNGEFQFTLPRGERPSSPAASRRLP